MRVARPILLAAIAAALAAHVVAAPLDEAACGGLKTEREALITKGVQADMARGPEWGKANLPPERLREVARFIEVEEQLAFRCPRPKVVQPKDKDEDKGKSKSKDEGEGKAGAKAKAKAAEKPAMPAKPQKQEKTEKKQGKIEKKEQTAAPVPEPEIAESVEEEAEPAKAIKRPAKKTRPEDTYVPPPSFLRIPDEEGSP